MQRYLAPGRQLTLNYHYVDVAYVPTDELLKRREQEEIRQRIQTYDIPKDVRHAMMKTVHRTPERTQIILEILQFVKEYATSPQEFHKAVLVRCGSWQNLSTRGHGQRTRSKRISNHVGPLPDLFLQCETGIADNSVNERLSL